MANKIIINNSSIKNKTLEILVADNDNVEIVEDFLSEDVVDIKVTAGKNSTIQYFAGINSKVSKKISRKVRVNENGKITFFELGIGQSFMSNLEIELCARQAAANIFNLTYVVNDEVIDLQHNVFHLAPETNSKIITAVALGGSASVKYSGNIHINASMSVCKGRQDAHFLLLSKGAKVETAPNLSIENSDVECGHSVSITHLDDQKRFFLASRGLNASEAEMFLIQGHLAAVLNYFPAEIKKNIEKIIC